MYVYKEGKRGGVFFGCLVLWSVTMTTV